MSSSNNFDPMECLIPTVYCGDKNAYPGYKTGDTTIYTKKGTARQCFTKGFGAGMYSTKRKYTPAQSLQLIPYVGEVYERNFTVFNIKDLKSLKQYCRKNGKVRIKNTIRQCITKKNGVVDEKAYNSILRYLYDSGITQIPRCVKLY